VEAHIVVLPAKANDGFKKDDMIVRWALILRDPHKSSGGDSATKANK
jgi:hypothetical protein